MVDAHSATAADFEAAAQRKANSFWFWIAVGGVVWWTTSIWWAAVPAAVAVFQASLSFGATNAAKALREGTYKVWNANNGAPDGDATLNTSRHVIDEARAGDAESTTARSADVLVERYERALACFRQADRSSAPNGTQKGKRTAFAFKIDEDRRLEGLTVDEFAFLMTPANQEEIESDLSDERLIELCNAMHHELKST